MEERIYMVIEYTTTIIGICNEVLRYEPTVIGVTNSKALAKTTCYETMAKFVKDYWNGTLPDDNEFNILGDDILTLQIINPHDSIYYAKVVEVTEIGV